MKPATCTAVVALLGLSWAASAFAQAGFRPPSFVPPFNNASSLLPGGRQAFGEALAERAKDSSARAADAMARSSSCETSPQVRVPGSSGICTDYALGNVTLARYSGNFAPIIVNVNLKKD